MSTLTKVITALLCLLLTAAIAYCVIVSVYSAQGKPALQTTTATSTETVTTKETVTTTETLNKGRTDSLSSVTLKQGKLRRKLPPAGKDSSIALTVTDTTGLIQTISLSKALDSITLEYAFPFENILPVRTDTLVRTTITSLYRTPPAYNTWWFGAVCGVALTLLLFLISGN